MRNGIIGPNRCGSCGGEYGRHSESCPVRKAREAESQREEAIDEMFEWFEENKGKLDLLLKRGLNEEL